MKRLSCWGPEHTLCPVSWRTRGLAEGQESVGVSQLHLGGCIFSISYIFAQSRTISEIFSQFLGEPLDGPHAQLGAKVSVEGRRRPSLQRKNNSWMNEIKICWVLWWAHKDVCVEAVPAGDVPIRWLCSQRCPSPPMNTAYGWSLLCSFHGISHSCGETENEKANAVSIKFCFRFNLELHNYNDWCFSIGWLTKQYMAPVLGVSSKAKWSLARFFQIAVNSVRCNTMRL